MSKSRQPSDTSHNQVGNATKGFPTTRDKSFSRANPQRSIGFFGQGQNQSILNALGK